LATSSKIQVLKIRFFIGVYTMKKIFALLAILTLAACGKEQAPSTSEVSSAADAAASAVASATEAAASAVASAADVAASAVASATEAAASAVASATEASAPAAKQ
jgi:uncharacterized lipoprotein YajG